MAKAFTYEIVKKIAVISDDHPGLYGKPCTLELNIVAMGDRPAKVDIRGWNHDAKEFKMGKGISLSLKEAVDLTENLCNFLNDAKSTALVNDEEINEARVAADAKANKPSKTAELEKKLAESQKQQEQMMAMMQALISQQAATTAAAATATAPAASANITPEPAAETSVDEKSAEADNASEESEAAETAA